ncbi:hypothetical protein AYI68_g923 [Smittium mucronatum]|uniref:Uncharacterized protein n=1 Tax=Smittium mucronatum TaxID=133383 RepID=A0A1R0H6Q8_9FUNG|nr:hypothetical protein AYI68_g923 [Smittium mucronatum]
MHGYPYLEKERKYNVTGTARGIMTPAHDLVFINAQNQTLGSLHSLIFNESPNSIGRLSYRTPISTSENERLFNSSGSNDSSNYQGFPVISSTETMYILGYMSSNDLRLGLETATLNRNEFSLDTKCFFGYSSETNLANSQEDLSGEYSVASSSNNPSGSRFLSGSTPNLAESGNEYFDFEDDESVYVDLRPYMDHSPMTVFPDSSIELVIDIFRQLVRPF